MEKQPILTVDTYITSFPKETQVLLQQMRATIKSLVPEAIEVISYQMPAFKYKGRILVYYAGYEKHIGLYPTTSGIENFKQDFGSYKWSKGAVQFPLNKELPIELITKIVKFRAVENELKKR